MSSPLPHNAGRPGPPPALPPMPAAPPLSAPPAGSEDRRMRAVLLFTLAMTAVYGVQVIIDVLRPHYDGELAHRWVGWLNPPIKGIPEPAFDWYKVSFWCYVAALPVAAAIWLIGTRRARGLPDAAARARATRLWQAWVVAVLLLPYPLWALDPIANDGTYLLLCMPSTAYALWLVHRMQRYSRVPLWMLLGLFAWGAVIGVGFGGSMIQWWYDYSGNFLAPDAATGRLFAVAEMVHKQSEGAFLFAGVFEELGKGSGVLLAYLLLRRHIDNVVSGIVLGAASGAGFNLMEAAQYMAKDGGANGSREYFTRQSLGLMAGHVAFTAAIGAGIGIARQLKDGRARRLAIACGFGIAIAGHYANDVFFTYVGDHKEQWFSPGNATDMLVITPLTLVLFQGPLVLLYILLVRRGLKDQVAALTAELGAEAATGSAAVTTGEVPVLLRPGRRLYLRLRALKNEGSAGYLRLTRLHDAQLRLGMARWHRSRGETDPSAPDEQSLREHVLRLKYAANQMTSPTAGQQVAR